MEDCVGIGTSSTRMYGYVLHWYIAAVVSCEGDSNILFNLYTGSPARHLSPWRLISTFASIPIPRPIHSFYAPSGSMPHPTIPSLLCATCSLMPQLLSLLHNPSPTPSCPSFPDPRGPGTTSKHQPTTHAILTAHSFIPSPHHGPVK